METTAGTLLDQAAQWFSEWALWDPPRVRDTNGSTPRFSPGSTKTTSISLLTTKPLFAGEKKVL